MPFHRPSRSLAVLALLLAAPALAQSLGEIAEREKKKAPPRTGRVYTEEDLRSARGGTFSAPAAVTGESEAPGEAADDKTAATSRLREWLGRTLRMPSEREAAHAALQAVVDSQVLFKKSKPDVERMLGGSTPCRRLLAGQGLAEGDACWAVGRLPEGVPGSPEFLVVGFGKDGLSDRVEAYQAR